MVNSNGNPNTNTTIKEKKAEFLQIIEHANSCECARDHVYSETWLDSLIAVVQTETKAQTLREAVQELQSLRKKNTTGDSYVSTHNIALNLGIEKRSVNRVHEEKSEEHHATNGNLEEEGDTT